MWDQMGYVFIFTCNFFLNGCLNALNSFFLFKCIKFIFYTHLLIKTFIVKYNSLTCLTLYSPSLYLFFLIKFILIDEIILHLTHKIVADLNKSSPISKIQDKFILRGEIIFCIYNTKLL